MQSVLAQSSVSMNYCINIAWRESNKPEAQLRRYKRRCLREGLHTRNTKVIAISLCVLALDTLTQTSLQSLCTVALLSSCLIVFPVVLAPFSIFFFPLQPTFYGYSIKHLLWITLFVDSLLGSCQIICACHTCMCIMIQTRRYTIFIFYKQSFI